MEPTIAIGAFERFLATVLTTHESGGGVYLILWILLALLMVANIVQFRTYRKKSDEEIKSLQERLTDYDHRYEELNTAFDSFRARYSRLQKRNAVLGGMLVANLGTRKLPDGFWEKIMSDDQDYVPDLSAPTETIVEKQVV